MHKPRQLIWLVLLLSLILAIPAYAQEERFDLGIITVRQKSLAEKLRKDINAGAKFDALAKKHSVGPTAARGGRLGRVPLNKLRPEFQAAVKSLKPGVPSNVVLTEGGFNILYIFPPVQAPLAKTPLSASTPKPSTKPLPQHLAVDTTLPAHLQARQLFTQAIEFLAAGDFQRAEDQLKQTLAKNKMDQGAVMFAGALNAAKGSEKKMKSVQTMASGVMALQIGELEDALNQYKQAVTANPQLWEALVLSANVMANLGRMDQAMQFLEKCLKINPKADTAYVSLGTIAREMKQNTRAKQLFNEALNLNPKSAKALYQLGAMALDEQKHQDAERMFKASLAIDPYQFDAFNDLGMIYAMTGRKEQAAQAYQDSLKANPGYAPAHLNMGNLYASQDKFNQAIDEYNKALALDPTLAEAHNNLAAAYVLLENWPMAIMHADKALSMNFAVAEVVLRKVAPHRKKQ